jgi:hypothetical protein
LVASAKAPESARLPDLLFDAIRWSDQHRAALTVGDRVDGLMFDNRADALQGYAAGIMRMGVRSVKELLGQWLEFPQVMNSWEDRCEDAATFAARHRERFTRDPDASDLRMAFGREQPEKT